MYMQKRTEKNKAIHEHCKEENERHEFRRKWSIPNLTDIVVEFEDAKGRHAEKKCQKK